MLVRNLFSPGLDCLVIDSSDVTIDLQGFTIISTGLFGSTGGTVSGNTVLDTVGVGISVICPANVLQNTATSNTGGNLVLNGAGCNVDNNLAP